jgi:hypothetical protein
VMLGRLLGDGGDRFASLWYNFGVINFYYG